MTSPARLGRLVQSQTAFFLCDIQAKFRDGIHHFDRVADVAKRMVVASSVLKIPIAATEQYPQGLGKLVEDLNLPASTPVIPKTTFSMLVPEIRALLKEKSEIKSVVLFGIEAHACVQATALELLPDYDVHVLVDGVSSRSPLDRSTALERMKAAGVFLTTTESVLLEIMRDSKHPKFREIQKLIMKPTPHDW